MRCEWCGSAESELQEVKSGSGLYRSMWVCADGEDCYDRYCEDGPVGRRVRFVLVTARSPDGELVL